MNYHVAAGDRASFCQTLAGNVVSYSITPGSSGTTVSATAQASGGQSSRRRGAADGEGSVAADSPMLRGGYADRRGCEGDGICARHDPRPLPADAAD